MAATLLQLAYLISSSAQAIDARCKSLSKEFPSLDNPPQNDQEDAIRADPEVAQAISLIVAAAHQLIATVQMPAQTLLSCSWQFLLSAALGTANETGVAEILREAGPEGCHVNEIAKKNKMEPSQIGRLLRPLATHHIFREVSPDVFAHNRVSICMDTGKSSEAVLNKPESKYDGTAGLSALVGLITDENFKAAAYIPDFFNDTISRRNNNFKMALHKAFNTEDDLFTWLDKSGNEKRMKRFPVAMQATLKLSPPTAILQGFAWDSLPSGGVVVDVGGGIGAVSMEIAKNYPHLHVVVQDRLNTVLEAENVWKQQLPQAISEKRVTFEAQDFFEPQPPRKVEVFLLKYILHDWPDDLAIKILQHLRSAAEPSTKLLIVDYIVPYVCWTDRNPTSIGPPTPEPLLANLGAAWDVPYMVDLQMIAITGGQQRTLDQTKALLSQSGWKLVAIHGPHYQEKAVAIPV